MCIRDRPGAGGARGPDGARLRGSHQRIQQKPAAAFAAAAHQGEGENEPKIKALVAALQSQQVKDFMEENYKGAVVSVGENPTDGYDSSIDYDALNGETGSCAATPAPHCEVLEVCKDILAAKGITLDIQEYDDYVIPNTIVDP